MAGEWTDLGRAPLEIWRLIAAEEVGEGGYRSDNGLPRALALVNRAFNVTFTASLYETVNLEALHTLLNNRRLLPLVRNAILVCGYSRSPDYYWKPDTSGCPSSAGEPFQVDAKVVRELGLDEATVSDLAGGHRKAMASLLVAICPNLERVHMVWSPADEDRIPCATPVLSILHPNAVAGGRMACITRVDLCSPSNDVRGNSENFTAVALVRLMSLPAIHTITIEFMSHTRDWPDDLVSRIHLLHRTSSLQRLALRHCKMQSARVLKDILSIPKGLRHFIFHHRPFMLTDLDNLDLSALSDTLVSSPCIATLSALEVLSMDPTPSSHHAFGLLELDGFQVLDSLTTSCRYIVRQDLGPSFDDMEPCLPLTLRHIELSDFAQVFPNMEHGRDLVANIRRRRPGVHLTIDRPPSAPVFEYMSRRKGTSRYTTFSTLPFSHEMRPRVEPGCRVRQGRTRSNAFEGATERRGDGVTGSAEVLSSRLCSP
jgi:hypothetical protein